jgi:NTE family protein
MKKGLCVSVGGSQGAYAGGIIESKINNGVVYDNLYGSSVGALVIPFAAIGDVKSLKEVFTTSVTDDIYTTNPFKVLEQNNGMFRYTLHYYNIFKNLFIHKKPSLGNTRKLRNTLIPKFFPSEYKLGNKKLSIMVTNISTGELEIKEYNDYTREEYMDWVWASTCAPPFMSIAHLGDCYYMDGGILSQVPIRQAILDGCDDIDIIILSKENHEWPIEHIRNFLHAQVKVLLLMMNKIQKTELNMGYLTSISKKKVRLNFHYTNRRLTNNSLIFDPEMMSKWWDEGYEYSENNEQISFLINGKKNSYKLI